MGGRGPDPTISREELEQFEATMKKLAEKIYTPEEMSAFEAARDAYIERQSFNRIQQNLIYLAGKRFNQKQEEGFDGWDDPFMTKDWLQAAGDRISILVDNPFTTTSLLTPEREKLIIDAINFLVFAWNLSCNPQKQEEENKDAS